MALTPEDLLRKLKEENSFAEYYRYLNDRYGINQQGTHFNLLVNDVEEACDITGFNEQFALEALKKDLTYKSLEKINWIAEAESQFTNQPFLAALDRYYRFNADAYNSKEELQNVVRNFEQTHHGHAHFQYAPEHEHKDD
ncbi:MAG: hypothetical protein H0Z35_11455 [Thermoanaerobacteraceae bacterium]|nr:hypothetical protein [Thermoanaerobacteraceae bacterium]